MATLHHIYWWNLENLFDIQDSPRRPEWLQKQLNAELKGWTEAVLDKKIAQQSSIIKKFNDGKGPDILGVCEIENEFVVQKLMDKVSAETGRTYKVLHHDTKDQRGIDIAIIYDQTMYHDDGRIFSLEVMKRAATRDLFQINLTTTNGSDLIVIGNHWPSRMEGKYESEPYRIMVAETLSYWIERIHEIKAEQDHIKDPAIVVMGDFNDQPFDRSINEYLLSTSNIERVKNAKSPSLFNTMFPFLDEKYGTFVFGNDINLLDQFHVSKSLIVKSPEHPFKFLSSQIIRFPELVKGQYNTPVKFGRPSASEFNDKGYSDHLPIELIIEEV
jgi:predicted extracellular nuclease